ncbi:unnamed protein product [Symbiodinium necroappetens]|uniref:Uncharacterized protein n=1 Tax=Symbiodinium necroappetens TaxID=1628268 RepID=A0A813BA27_9DINO|nr:unnamed protein product [Symbiodinium necroappetens]
MTGKLKHHQALKAEGLLRHWSSGLFTLFVSHQWLGRHHPDPNSEQLRVLQGLLRNLLAKTVTIEYDVLTQFFGGTGPKAELDKLVGAYLWLDYICVPQLVESASSSLAYEQLRYVWSIHSYVDRCALFLALVPPCIHHDTGVPCSLNSWLDRGWCRTEFWCKSFSTRSKVPIVVVKGEDSAQYMTGLSSLRYPVYSGMFAVEDDKAACSLLVQKALMKYLSMLRAAKNKTAYRLYLSLFEQMTGCENKKRSMEEFLHDFCFSEPVGQHKSLGPVVCAALSGDHELLRNLVSARASLHARAPGMLETFNAELMPLHFALEFRSQDLRVLQTLLELRADPNCSTLNASSPLSSCRTVDAVDQLVENRADVNLGTTIAQLPPIHFAVGAIGAPCEVVARLLELRADVLGGGGGVACSPLHNVAFSGDSHNDLRNAQLLLDNKADVNQRCRPEGIFRPIELMARVSSRCAGRSGALVRFFGNLSSTPLGWCAVFGNEGLLTFLLRERADPEIRNNRGLRAIDLATSERVRTILRDPVPHIYLLESGSELVTEQF